MSGLMGKVTAAAVATALIAAPTASIAAAPVASVAAAAPATATPATANPWLALSAMTTSSSSAATAAAQDYDDDRGPGFPPLPVLAVILATIGVAIYILASDDDGDLDGFDISPV